jgi:hypothetical protein
VELGRGGPRLKISLPGPVPATEPERQGALPQVRPDQPRVTHAREVPGGLLRNTPLFAGRRRLAGFMLAGLVLAGVAALLVHRFRTAGAGRWPKIEIPRAAFGNEGGEVPTPKPTAVVDCKVVADMGEQIYPSYLIASATMKKSPLDALESSRLRLGDKRGVLGVEITNPGANTKVRVEFEENEIMRASVIECVLSEAGSVYRVYPQVNYRYEALARIRQTTAVSLSARVVVNGGAPTQHSRAVRVASVNECPFLMAPPGEDAPEEYVQMYWMFAAYVNESHPVSDELRREALKSGIVRSFAGYQGGREEVYRQVFAIWNVLQRRGVRYSDITTTANVSEEVRSQHVRFIDQSINNNQANCVDGSVLFASVLRQIGIEPLLVLVPGHMFVGFALDSDGREVDYLETVMIGKAGEARLRSEETAAADSERSIRAIQGLLEPVAEVGLDGKSSLDSFVEALKTARSSVDKHFEAGELSGNISSRGASTVRRARVRSQRILILEARQLGVMPIGYQP